MTYEIHIKGIYFALYEGQNIVSPDLTFALQSCQLEKSTGVILYKIHCIKTQMSCVFVVLQ